MVWEVTQIHPNQASTVELDQGFIPEVNVEVDLTSEDEIVVEQNVPQFILISQELNFDKELYSQVEFTGLMEIIKHVKSLSYDTTIPRFSFDVDKFGVVPSLDYIFANLNLDIDYRSLILKRATRSFDKDFMYDSVRMKRFENAIIYRDGYLMDDSNYFLVNEENFNVGTKCTMLRNSRVILYWRNVDLNELSVKKILTTGLLLLAGKLERSKLAEIIRDKLPNGQFEVNISYEPNSYVLIGIEAPVFRY